MPNDCSYQCQSSYIAEMNELIPIKPRTRIQYDNEQMQCDDFEKFTLLHMNMRLCTSQKIPIDARIIVIGASVVALSFLESLVFK